MPTGIYVRSEAFRQHVSAAMMGRVVTLETRAKQSAAEKGRIVSEETRSLLSKSQIGHTITDSGRAKITGQLNPCWGKKGSLCTHWKGGMQIAMAKYHAKRRNLGHVNLNEPFIGCEGHHVDNEQVINLPKVLHRSIYHNQHTGKGMAAINAVAYNFLFKQEVDAAVREER